MPDLLANDPFAIQARAPIGPCWTCTWWRGVDAGGYGAACGRPKHTPSQARPERGCAFYSREPGCDDEVWTPMFAAPPARP